MTTKTMKLPGPDHPVTVAPNPARVVVSVAGRVIADTKAALDRGVFGAPSYVIDDEIFWGQDRLEFVDRKLAA